MEKASARGLELEASAAARLNQFCGLPAAAAERAVADGLHVESGSQASAGPPNEPVKSGQAA
jgi:hypothetical protein